MQDRGGFEETIPQLFRQTSQFERSLQHQNRPFSQASNACQRKVPIESKEAIDRELDFLIEEEIITEQVEPTPWVSSVTFPRKPNGEVRVCLDPSNLNKAIIREHHKPMTVEEIAHELAGATVYTKADALKAFLQIHLTHEASLLTTFNSHRGRLRFLRMPFGAKMSQDVFQLRMDAILEQCPGVIGIHDDMVIFGVDQEDHDANLINLLNVCQKEGLVLNSKKTGTSKRESHILRGRVQRTRHASRPQEGPRDHRNDSANDKQQLQSFLGMVNYMGTFIPNLSHHTEPLRAMLKKDNVFHWEDQQTRSFQQVKTLIAKANTHTVEILRQGSAGNSSSGRFSQRAGSLSHTETQRKGPTDRLCQQESHGRGDEICQHRTGTSSHRLCLPKV